MIFENVLPFLPNIWQGMKTTLELLVLATTMGIFIGTLLALARLSSGKWLPRLATIYVNYFRTIPLLLVILWFFIGLPMLLKALNHGVPVPIGAFTSCLVAFALFEAAYFAEIIRAGIQSISVGQRSAAYALGMSYTQTMRLVILPQVFRKMLPLIMQQTIILFQDLTLVYAVGLMDFFNSTRTFGDNSGNLNEFLLFAATVYFIISFCASTGIKHLQKHLQKGMQR
ncbi:MAG: ABC transporter permease subunit [Neisseriaceae bacterium]|nr:ABC transporter permease subunit [Neisseriaceae bacterium]